MELKNHLNQALDFEQKGHDIYRENASSTENPIVKKVFNYLAEQENKHKEAIKNFIKKKTS
jgi:rubrerythrin